MFIVIIITLRFAAMVASTSWVKDATRSIADRFGSAPLCWGLRMPFVRAV
jgi:hypothetical protein